MPIDTEDALRRALQQYHELTQQLKPIEAARKALSAEVAAAICLVAGDVCYTIPDVLTARVQTKVTRTLKPELLIAAGVGPEVVQAATVETTSAPFLTLTYPKGDLA